MKGVILAGGTGSRLHPLTRITNKHLLPIYDRPMISYAIEALVNAGVRELMLVTGGTHAGEFLRLLGNGNEFAITGVYFYDETVWAVLPELRPSGRGELEITDVNNWYLSKGLMEYDVLEGFWGDAGESIQSYYAVNDFVRASATKKDA